MPLMDFTTPFTGGPTFYTGTGSTNLVPSLYPVALNGRPYLLDLESNQFIHQFEPRVRDSSDNSTAPGESAINPQGFWRRGQKSWHLGAGQYYADDAESQDFRFYKSKGVDVWTKGQLSLLNTTKVSLSSAATEQHMIVNDGYVVVSLNGDLKYSADPFASSPTWTDVTGEPVATCKSLATNGTTIYAGFTGEGVRTVDTTTTPWSVAAAKFVNSSDTYYMLGFAKQYMFGSHDHKLRSISSGGSPADVITPGDTAFRWVGVATGQNAVYAAGYAGKKSLIYKITIKADGTLDAGVVALELPTGEIVTTISGYLGFVLLGTNRGVRFCSTDASSNLVAGLLIPTTGDVKKFSSNDRFAYFTWSNYDGVSGGLGRLDLSRFTSANTPAYATDLMYDSTADVTNVIIFNSKPVFIVSGVGVIAEDTASLVASGSIETGTYTWDIPDKKFVPRFDIRSPGLSGTVELFTSYDRSSFVSASVWSTPNQTQHVYPTSEQTLTEAAYRLVLTRSATVTSGPTVTRWMARAWASPPRSQIITVPVLLHQHLSVEGQDLYLDVETELELLRSLVENPGIVSYQERERVYSVIVEDVEFRTVDSSWPRYLWEGTAIITMRTVAE